MWLASALPSDGKLICCDCDPTYRTLAEQHWRQAGLDKKIDYRNESALKTLEHLSKEGEQGTFDFIVIDADKPNVSAYFEAAFSLLRSGGVVAIDDVLRGGRVATAPDANPGVQAMRRLTERIHADRNQTMSLLPIGDGILLIQKT